MERPRSAPSRKNLYTFAVSQCLLVLPAAFCVAVATLRGLQPHEYEPARTSSMIFEWMTRHLTRLDAAVMFLLFPAFAFTLGMGKLLQNWRHDELFRWDALAFAAVLRRNLHFIILSAGALAGAAILMATVIHIITD